MSGPKDKFIQDHYENVAKNFGLSGRCTIQDPKIRTHELQFLRAEITNYINTFEKNPVILDLGCGNGYTIEVLSQEFPNSFFIGIEPHRELLELAQTRLNSLKNKNVKFLEGNALTPLYDNKYHEFCFDIIISERMMVNLTSDQQQEQVFKNISESLLPGGNYLLIESFLEPLQKLNLIRKENLLGEALKPSEHNLYMKFTLLRKLIKFGLFTQETEYLDNLTPHFFLTRIFHPLTRSDGSKMKENILIDTLEKSGSFERLKGQFLSPIQFFKFAKKY